MTIPEKLRQAYHGDLTDVPLLLDAADEIERLRAALEHIAEGTYAMSKVRDIASTALETKP